VFISVFIVISDSGNSRCLTHCATVPYSSRFANGEASHSSYITLKGSDDGV
jgi:hypothetical protein